MKRLRDFSLVAGGLMFGCGRAPESLLVDPARECQTVEQLYAPSEHGGPHMSRTLWRVHECPEDAGRIATELLSSTRLEHDMAVVQQRTSLAQYIHDSRVLEAALALAADSAATLAARLGALRALLWAKAPGHPYYSLSRLLMPPECVRPSCVSSYTGHFYGAGPVVGDTNPWPVFGRPMPANYIARIDSVAASIQLNIAVPDKLGVAAGHVAAFPPDAELQGQ